MSTNVAYKEVSLKAKERVRGYEDVEVSLEPCNRSTEGDKPNARARSIKLVTYKAKASE